MKVAFLILAHHQPEHLSRLVRSISAGWNDIYIHIDRTSELEPFVSCIDRGDSPVFLETSQRIDYTWCGFSSVKAILSLLSAALEADQHYDRFCLLSGADFPIKSIDEIKDAFAGDTEFMRVDRRLTADKNNSHAHVVRYYHFLDLKGARGAPPDGVIERELYRDIDLYHGATWWALSYECIGYIVDYLEQHPDYIEFHKYTFCPDEVFFHSIVKSSPFAEKLKHDFEKKSDREEYKLSNEHGCHYIDWNAKEKKLPKILDSNDLGYILKSEMFFARKMDANRSASLLSSLEKMNQNGISEYRIGKSESVIQHMGRQGLSIHDDSTKSPLNSEKKYIFILSHMRSFSSLLCHILGSNLDVSGYAESNLSYKHFENLYTLHEKVQSMTGEQNLSEYILDKVLHNYWHVPDEMLKNERFRYIFLLRRPEDALKSIVYMLNGFSVVNNDKEIIESAVKHYLSRLTELINLASKCHGNAVFIKSEDIINRTTVVLNGLTKWLELSEPLTDEYKTFSLTGKPNYGDPSRYIRTGKVSTENKAKKGVCIPEKLLVRCQMQYQECYKVLRGIGID